MFIEQKGPDNEDQPPRAAGPIMPFAQRKITWRSALKISRLHPAAISAYTFLARAVQPPCIGCGCSSVVEHNLAKVGVEGSNPFARSKFPNQTS
jgi:hypothetical protein